MGLAEAVNAAFARWDLSHLHEFELADGRRIGFVDPDRFEDDEVVEDHAAVKVADAVGLGDEFGFVFDFGDWEHRCRVLAEKADPRQEWGSGPLPKQPVVIWGWGLIPISTAASPRRSSTSSREDLGRLSRRWHTTAQPSSMNARCNWSSRS